jgi:hypothetical protein
LKCFTIKFLGVASFAQERIFLDEHVRFLKEIAIYNELIVLRLVRGSLSADRLLKALRCVLSKHKILRTSLIFNNDVGALKQHITNNHQTFTLASEQRFENEHELLNIIYQTTINPTLLDLSSGRVFYCQILKQRKMIYEKNDDNLITDSSVLIFAFHHAIFDRTSSQLFFNDLSNAYDNNMIVSADEQSLQYIDYSVHERLIDMTSSQQFWHSQFQGYDWKKSLSLPVDRHHSSNHQRSGLAFTTPIILNNDISNSFINYATSHHITLFQLGLATFYLFLFKLSHAQTDSCIASLNANRYRTELQNMIGMFVSILPFRIQFDSHWSFDQLVEHVREKCLSILEHSRYPLQHILTDFRLNSSNISFLDTLFDFITISSDVDHFSLNGACLEQVSLQQSFDVAKFDFSMIFMYNSTLNNNQLCCSLVSSRDLFDETTVTQIGRRFQYFCEQLFSTETNAIQMNESMTSISGLSLILPEEADEIEAVKFQRLENVVNEGM